MPPLIESERQILLRLAREGLEEAILSKPPSTTAGEIPPALERAHSAFVTLRKDCRLRGCVGRIDATAPLYQTVRECAVGAAIQDGRFDPVLPEEVACLQVEISVLSEFQQVQPEQIEAGRHGLMVSQGVRRGLLLPQVAVEWNWDSIQFLGETCAKAGLPRNAWQQGARIHAFTAQVFAEHEPNEQAWTKSCLGPKSRG